MSAAVFLNQPKAGFLLADGASYDATGRLTAIETKVAILPDINMAIYTRGPAGSAHLAAYNFVDQYPSFDNFVANAPEDVRIFYHDFESYMRASGHPDLEFYFAGWSDRRKRPEMYLIRCGYEDSAFNTDQNVGHKAGVRKKPFKVHPISEFAFAPGIFTKADLTAAHFPTHRKPKDLNPEIDLLHVMELMRCTPCTRFPGDREDIRVGGFAELIRIDADGTTRKTIAEWPDAIGEHIRVQPPLDWTAWRASRGVLH